MSQTETSSPDAISSPIARAESMGRAAAIAGFLFHVWLQGTGRTEEAAWDDANEAFFLEPGDPVCAERLDTSVFDPQDSRWPAAGLNPGDLSRTPVKAGRRFLFLFRVQLFGLGATAEDAWGTITAELQGSPGGSELAGLEEVTLLHAAGSAGSQLELFALHA